MSDPSTASPSAARRDLPAQGKAGTSGDGVVECPLSYGQRALWFVYQLDPDSPAYNIMYSTRVRADVDRAALQRALQRLIDRHSALRTTYGAHGGAPVAQIHAHRPLPLVVIPAAGWDEPELDRRIQEAADRPFDLAAGPVLRAELFDRGVQPHVLLLTAAHITMDFWSLDQMLRELAMFYREAITGQPAPLPTPQNDYRDFVAWQEKMLSGPEGERLWTYWRDHLSGQLGFLDLPTDRPRPPVQTYRGGTHRFNLPDALTRRLAEVSKAEGATLYMTLLASFLAILYRYSGQRDIVIGSTTAGRNLAEWEGLIGYFLNVMPLRGRMSPDMTFQELLGQVRDAVLGGLDHQDFPFPQLVERLAPPRDVSRSPIFQVAFNWDRPRKTDEIDIAAAARDKGDLCLEPLAIAQQGSAFDLTMVLLHRGDSLAGALQYNSDLFDEATIKRMAGHLTTLLEGAASNPRQKLADLPLVSRAERQMLIEDWNDTASEFPRDKCLHDLVTDQAARTPDKIAVAQGDRQLTYRELEENSNRLARYLQKLGVGPDVLVGLCLERTPELLTAMLGILKAGGAYVPLAPGTPAERLAYMLAESRTPVLLTQRDLADQWTGPDDMAAGSGSAPDRKIVRLDDDWPAIAREAATPLPAAARPEHRAYVIFTSGSTGRPKGVEIEHRSVVNFLTSMQRRPGIGPEDKLLAVTTVTFDISVLELFLPLAVGAEVIVVSADMAADGKQLAQTIVDSGATIMQATPATWRLLIQAGWQGDSQLKILCGGEALPRDLADLLLPRCGSLWNMYGPTETTIWSSVDRVLPAQGPVLIGPPIANTQFYILDERRRPAPMGVPGELFIGGDGLARGYLNQPELTSARFVDDPFHPGGQRMYQTGDLTRFRPDGRVDFLGRLDHQVKVRGFRIELGEIEAVLLQHPAVRETVVVARQVSNQADDKQLVAYLVPVEGTTPGTSELREFLKQKLPDYMVPAHYVTLPALPLNPSGKVDRKALPAPDFQRPDLAAEYVAPRNDLEANLAEAWASVLGLDQVGVHDDYFDLGGASMQSLEIAAHAESLGIKFTPAFLFQHPTVAELAEALAARGVSAPSPAAPAVERPAKPAVDSAALAEAPATAVSPAAGRLQTVPAAGEVSAAPTARGNTIISSVGIYLPPNEVTTDEVIRGCRNRVWFPLEKMAGIHTRRMSGEGDYCIDLARKAVDECLAYSKYGPDDIDLVICCNITRGIAPCVVSIEPNTSLQLKRLFGFKHALAFDITNACGGMFTGVNIADAFLQTGAIRRALVVSGEYITGITRTAQLEISGFLDERIACLTVGDAGAAVLLESADNKDVGFHALELYTVSKYNRMCIGRLTEEPHGGAIMHVPDPIQHTHVSAEHSVMHATYMFEKSPWPPEDMQHLIIHQTSRRSLRDGMRAINKAFRRKVATDANTLDNLYNRGNTASTTHFVALWDQILGGKINSGERAVFAISGSGQTIGTAFYTIDDLPDRLRNYKTRGLRPAKAVAEPYRPLRPSGPSAEITSLATIRAPSGGLVDSMQLAYDAAEECIRRWGRDRNDLDLVLFAGMTRSEPISEPALATFVAGELKINDCIEDCHGRSTLAFDVYNTSLGFLNACQVATRMIQSGQRKRAMIVTSEVEINAKHFPDLKLEIAEAGSAIILEAAQVARRGFSPFAYHYDTDHHLARTITGVYRHGKPVCDMRVEPELHDYYLAAAQVAVDKLLQQEGLTLDRFKVLLPSQFSSAFNARLAKTLGFPAERMVDLGGEQKDYFSNSLAFSLQHVEQHRLVQPGDMALIVQVGPGVQAGCATYTF